MDSFVTEFQKDFLLFTQKIKDHCVTVFFICLDDDNRIVLQPTEGRSDCQNDYINACYINVSVLMSDCVCVFYLYMP